MKKGKTPGYEYASADVRKPPRVRAPRKPRLPRKGEYYVFHDDPMFVMEITEATENGGIYMINRANHEKICIAPSRFREFYTRVPV